MQNRGVIAAMLLSVFGPGAMAQTTSIDLRSQSRNVDFGSAASTRPFKTGSALPATCTTGETFFSTTAPAGRNIFGCIATNTWTVMGGSDIPLNVTDVNRVLSNDGTGILWRPTMAGLIADTSGLAIDDSVISRYSSGSTLPPACGSYGLLYFLITESLGQKLYYCNGSSFEQVKFNGVTSFNGRTGDTSPQAGDYSVSQIADAVDRSSANTYSSGAKQTFSSSATTAGLTVACSALPSSPVNGDIHCDSGDSFKVKVRSNGAWVTIAAPGSASSVSTTSNNGYFAPWGVTGAGSAVNPSIGTVNRVYLYQFVLPYQMDFSRISVNVAAAGAAGCRINIALFDSAKAKLQEGSLIDCTTTGAKSVSISPSAILTAGVYYLAIGANDTTTTVTNVTSSSSFTPLLNAGANARWGYCSNTLDPSAAMPASCGTFSKPSITSLPWAVLEP